LVVLCRLVSNVLNKFMKQSCCVAGGSVVSQGKFCPWRNRNVHYLFLQKSVILYYEGRNQLKDFGSVARYILQLYGSFRGFLFYSVLVQCFMAFFFKEFDGRDGCESVSTKICLKLVPNLFCKLSTSDDPVRKLPAVGAPDCCHITDSYTTPAAWDQQDKVRWTIIGSRPAGGRGILLISWIYQEGRDTGWRNVRTSLRFFFVRIIMYCFV